MHFLECNGLDVTSCDSINVPTNGWECVDGMCKADNGNNGKYKLILKRSRKKSFSLNVVKNVVSIKKINFLLVLFSTERILRNFMK